MSITRRRFVKAGVLAAAVAAFPIRTLLAQSFKERDGNPTEAPPQQSDILGNYSKETFKALLNSVFQLHTASGIVEVTLVGIEDLPASKGGECFALLFRGGSRPQPQETYTLVHGTLGTFQLLMVPGGADQNGAQSYLATLNRLSLADLSSTKAPGRVRTAPAGQRNTTTTTTTSTTTTNSSPANTVAAPKANTTVAPVTQSPAPAPTARPKRRRKPAGKRVDDLNLIR